jgi:hypothetical protein
MIESTDRPILRGECAVAGSAARGQNAQRPAEPVTMLAYARLGVVIHSQVSGGFSGNACGTRIADSGSRILITMDRYYSAGDLADHIVKADEVVAEARRQGHDVDKVVVGRRHRAGTRRRRLWSTGAITSSTRSLPATPAGQQSACRAGCQPESAYRPSIPRFAGRPCNHGHPRGVYVWRSGVSPGLPRGG